MAGPTTTVLLEVLQAPSHRALVKSRPVPLDHKSLADERITELALVAHKLFRTDGRLRISFSNLEPRALEEVGALEATSGKRSILQKACQLVLQGACAKHEGLVLQTAHFARAEADMWRRLQSGPSTAKLVPRLFNSGERLLLVEWVEPFRHEHATLEGLIRHGEIAQVVQQVPSALLQCVWFLACAQNDIPGFRHNDFVARNIFLASLPSPSQSVVLDIPAVGVRFVVPRGHPRVLVGECEYAWALEAPRAFESEHAFRHAGARARVSGRRVTEMEDAGIVQTPSALYDVSTLICDVLDLLRKRSLVTASPDLARLSQQIRDWAQTCLGPFADEERWTCPRWKGRLTVEAQALEPGRIMDEVAFAPLDALARVDPSRDALFGPFRSAYQPLGASPETVKSGFVATLALRM